VGIAWRAGDDVGFVLVVRNHASALDVDFGVHVGESGGGAGTGRVFESGEDGFEFFAFAAFVVFCFLGESSGERGDGRRGGDIVVCGWEDGIIDFTLGVFPFIIAIVVEGVSCWVVRDEWPRFRC
jgi:hypothetical protein